MKFTAIVVLALISGSEAALRFGSRGPKGAGQPEPTKAAACQECQKHAPYLDTGDDCVCHASDIMTTFANDATKELTTRSKHPDGCGIAVRSARQRESGKHARH